MIDYIRLSVTYPVFENAFISEHWRYYTLKSGEPIMLHHRRAAWIRYYPLTGRWVIAGKILTLLYDTQVHNVDDLYGIDIDIFVNEINNYLQTILTVPLPDIRSFSTSRIDYCFNIPTPHVAAYLDVLNEGFRMTNNGSRVNYTQQMKKIGSAYIKTKADYADNSRRNYVLNYYNKLSRLDYLARRNTPIPPEDWQRAQNILRLEVQCGSQFIKSLCRKLSISRSFDDLLSYDVAYHAHELIYKRVFKAGVEHDFYTYPAAKKRLTNRTAKKALEASAEHHRITASKFTQGRKHIKAANIYPFAFLSPTVGVEVLVSPLKLILQKLEAIGYKTN